MFRKITSYLATKRFNLLKAIALCGFMLMMICPGFSQDKKRVVLQAFWWDYHNNNYNEAWSNYLTELAPRLKEMGIDAVWVPPFVKSDGPHSVGYSPFDQYDLGDKFQKGNLRTRMGDKDELLRMIAVMHANGIEVIEDIVLNHTTNAGSVTGAGGVDPQAMGNDKHMNFRYVSYNTPVTDETANDYLSRSGRWPKNWHNFHPNGAHNCTSGDICAAYWGPDICYWAEARGLSSNAIYNPVQESNYMRNETRKWFIWLKKQTGIDGYRFDAVKHFPADVTEDVLWNAMFNADWANGGENMFSVGEWVGGKNELDAWTDAVQGRAGTFDFGLRGFAGQGLESMVNSNGSFNMGNLPGLQQERRHRTVPFVNNHDTFRPQLDSNGKFTGWNHGSELAPHIDPRNHRLSAAYAVIMAVDGSPQIFMEDLFDLNDGKRFTHDPKDPSSLQVRSDIAKLIELHQKLDFKGGEYKVRHGSGDLLVIERSNKAVIAITDSWNWNNGPWRREWVATDFGPGVQLKDYAGGHGDEIRTTNQDGWFEVSTPGCDGNNAAKRRGFAVWAPVNANANFSLVPLPTTQEWELADDLGDSHPFSLKQGGQLPGNSTEYRTAGKIFAAAGKEITVNLFPTDATKDLTLSIFDFTDDEALLKEVNGTGELTLAYTPTKDGFIVLKARHTNEVDYEGQRAFIKATYMAPEVVDTKKHYSSKPLDEVSFAFVPEVFDGNDLVTLKVFTENTKFDNITEPLYLWTWEPSAPKGGQGTWTSTADKMKFEKVTDNEYHFQFVPNEFYASPFKGQIAFLVKTKNGSMQSGDLVFGETTTGVEPGLDQKILVYPNPSSGESVMLSIGDVGANSVNIMVTDMAGRRYYAAQMGANRTIQLPVLPRGMYLLNVDIAGKKVVKKIVVN
jgi:alpha-amylase